MMKAVGKSIMWDAVKHTAIVMLLETPLVLIVGYLNSDLLFPTLLLATVIAPELASDYLMRKKV